MPAFGGGGTTTSTLAVRMSPQSAERRLAAILSADVAGYSRLMAEDPEETVDRLGSHREAVTRIVEQSGGRLVDFTGDNFLAEFASARTAVETALAVMESVAAANAGVEDTRKMQFRMGIHLGDIQVEGDRIFGSGVNIAARLEGLAPPGGLCIGSAVREQLPASLALQYEDLGEHHLKNLPDPVRAFRVLTRPSTSGDLRPSKRRSRGPVQIVVAIALLAATAIATGIWTSRGRDADTVANEPPSANVAQERRMIVVLPFENLGEADQAFFAHGVTEAITSRLAVVENLGVISRTSAVQYANRDKTLQQMADELGVDYVLEGTVLRLGEQVRITPQLIRVADDTHLWADAYDREIRETSDIFLIHTDIAERVSQQLGLSLLASNGKAPTDSIEAYNAYQRGLEALARPIQGSAADRELAVEMFSRATDLDPDFALAWALLSEAHTNVADAGSDRGTARLEAAKRAVDRSLALSPELPEARRALGRYLTRTGEFERANDELEAVAVQRPNDSAVLLMIGDIRRREGDWRDAAALFERAARLDPRSSDPLYNLAFALIYLREYERADALLASVTEISPESERARGARRWNMALWKGPEAIYEAGLRPAGFDHLLTGRFEEALAHYREEDIAVEGARDYMNSISLERAAVYAAMGDAARAAANFEEARAKIEAFVEAHPKDDRAHSSLGEAYAGLGNKAKAIEHGELGRDLRPIEGDALEGPTRLLQLARIYAQVGKADLALDLLEEILSIPYDYSVEIMKVDTDLVSIRDHPRFRRIVGAGS